jgi:lipopolysaccharide transport system permease protein
MQAASNLATVLNFPARAIGPQRELIAQLAWREVIGRYKGSLVGLGWSFLSPLLMLAVYSFVFSVVFRSRWGLAQSEGPFEFALILFVGLMIHGIVAECITKSPLAIVSNPSYVKKVVFPLEVLPVVTLLSALFHFCVSVAVLVAGLVVFQVPLRPTILLLPVVVLPLAIGALALCWLLAALGVFLRDITQTTSILAAVLLFLSPVFYPASALPESYRFILAINPLTFIIEEARAVVFAGRLPDWSGLVLYFAFALILATLSLWIFLRMRKGFADVV